MKKPDLRTAFRAASILLLLSGLALSSKPAGAARSPTQTLAWPAISLAPAIQGLSSPTHIAHAGDGSGRLFVVEKSGRIRIHRNGSLLPDDFLDIEKRVLSGGEQGLLSVAFPPGYVGKGYFYVYYTNLDGDNQVSRFHLTNNPDLADASSEEPILTIPHPTFQNHNGGQLAFGPDGYLYIGTGDGGSGGDPNRNAQNPASLLGKVLRIDVETAAQPDIPGEPRFFFPLVFQPETSLPNQPNQSAYRIPPGNPFAGQSGSRPEIWGLGLRNPWRFSFDRQTGDLFLADVGQNAIEEVNFQPASSQGGENYGWNILEGSQCYPSGSGCTPPASYVAPVAEYAHGPQDSVGCSITGGMIYRGSTYSGLQGIYYYGDYCTGRLWGLQQANGAWQSQELLDTSINISSFGEDEAGEIYLADIGSGRVYHLTEAP